MTMRTCDIVMKGGITSGVVYPKAITKLAEKFRFINIGGTSAGAIAAAVTAAAEYRRRTDANKPNAGFGKVKELGDALIEKVGDDKILRLLSLFTPNFRLKRLFKVLLAGIGHDSQITAARKVVGKLLATYPLLTVAGMIPGTALAVISFFFSTNLASAITWVTIGVVVAMFGAVLAPILWMLYVFLRWVPNNYFGICSGMDDKATPNGVQPLTIWLNDYINEVAGVKCRRVPLTFDDLKNTKDLNGIPIGINLEMMTTNLTHGRPYRLPFKDSKDLSENHLFYFKKSEFLELFPKEVVTHMETNQRPITLSNRAPKPKEILERKELNDLDYYAMPLTEQLPVIVATRMSLSFPILLSAIPLYSQFRHPGEKNESDELYGLKRCWFTDGGFCSNFPLHFFDGPIPKRPTFSLDLIQALDNTPDDKRYPSMDANNGSSVVEHWNRFETKTSWNEASETSKSSLGRLFGFGSAMLETMRTWNDATQSRLPGYRDRIVTIPLTSKEGGLNLNMDEDKVTRLVRQGELSAERLIERFYPADATAPNVLVSPTRMNWDNHRWVRLRSQMAAFEKMLDAMRDTWKNSESGDTTFRDWLNDLNDDTTGLYRDLSYEPTKKQIAAIIKTMDLLEKYDEIWKDELSATTKAPRPRSELRHRAQI